MTGTGVRVADITCELFEEAQSVSFDWRLWRGCGMSSEEGEEGFGWVAWFCHLPVKFKALRRILFIHDRFPTHARSFAKHLTSRTARFPRVCIRVATSG